MKKSAFFNALIKETEDGWFFGQIEEVPEAMSQGKTIDELLETLTDALNLVLELKREETLKQYSGDRYISRQLILA